MKRRTLILLLCVGFIGGSAALLSNSDHQLPFSVMRCEALAPDKSEKITVEVIQERDAGVTNVSVLAFGKLHQMPKNQCDLLVPTKWNGISLSVNTGFLGPSLIVDLFGERKRETIWLYPNGKFKVGKQIWE